MATTKRSSKTATPPDSEGGEDNEVEPRYQEQLKPGQLSAGDRRILEHGRTHRGLSEADMAIRGVSHRRVTPNEAQTLPPAAKTVPAIPADAPEGTKTGEGGGEGSGGK